MEGTADALHHRTSSVTAHAPLQHTSSHRTHTLHSPNSRQHHALRQVARHRRARRRVVRQPRCQAGARARSRRPRGSCAPTERGPARDALRGFPDGGHRRQSPHPRPRYASRLPSPNPRSLPNLAETIIATSGGTTDPSASVIPLVSNLVDALNDAATTLAAAQPGDVGATNDALAGLVNSILNDLFQALNTLIPQTGLTPTVGGLDGAVAALLAALNASAIPGLLAAVGGLCVVFL
ncbi:hypothetical protein GGX14DRAFT_429390 [Mycena pura]|uniref:Uncharacterized protein n=1 Tax=Mycena pura TaxID=153505 RepID=A0AAD6VS67_9AGAR|nr:hypothetical protein GGX14DRAFT_429390 [Mycena pura]